MFSNALRRQTRLLNQSTAEPRRAVLALCRRQNPIFTHPLSTTLALRAPPRSPYEPPSFPPSTRVRIKNFHKTATEEHLWLLLELYGEVVDVELGHRSAYATFATLDGAASAVAAHANLGAQKLEITYAPSSDGQKSSNNRPIKRLSARGIPRDAEEHHVRAVFESYGQVNYVNLLPDYSRRHPHRGIALITFALQEAATAAFNAPEIMLGNNTLVVDYDQARILLPPLQRVRRAPSPYLSVNLVPQTATIEDLEAALTPFGECVYLDLPPPATHLDKHRGIGFVRFKTLKAARAAFGADIRLGEASLQLRYIHISYDEPTTPRPPPQSFNPPNRILYVGDVVEYALEEDLRRVLEPYGDIESIKLIPSNLPRRPHCRVGVVVFKTQEAATTVFNTPISLGKQWLKFDYKTAPPRGARPNKQLFISLHTYRHASESVLRKHFEQFGELHSVMIEKSALFAHVEFCRLKDAVMTHERYEADGGRCMIDNNVVIVRFSRKRRFDTSRD
uniref:RNA-binding domain-containing protein n=1 Tax=Mycena chlorophos TaxID=658473 RepID=A0ABQ0M557_MYCCL|nr:RNA-binding domain-containing protein [Mycena chlorophos]